MSTSCCLGGRRESGERPGRYLHQCSLLRRTSAPTSRLISSVLGLDVVLNLRNRHACIVHLAGIKRDVLADRATRAMLILEAEQIVLVPKTRHASAKTRQLFQNLWNVLRDLVGSPSSLVIKYCRRQHLNAFRTYCGLLRLLVCPA